MMRLRPNRFLLGFRTRRPGSHSHPARAGQTEPVKVFSGHSVCSASFVTLQSGYRAIMRDVPFRTVLMTNVGLFVSVQNIGA
jgi:hypothetical protein